MISVSVDFRKTRAKYHSKPGVVFFRIYGPTPDGSRKCLNANTTITGDDNTALDIHKEEILVLLRLIYYIVETLDKNGQPIYVYNVTEYFRSIMKDEERKNKLISKLDLRSPLRADLFSVGSSFHNYFQFVFPKPDEKEIGSKDLISFILYRSDVFKSENRISTFRSYNSLSKELIHFAGNETISWHEITHDFVTKFAEWLIIQGFKTSTQGYYLSMLRTILFQAKEHGYCSAESEWFRNVTTQAKANSQENNKEKIDIDVIRKIKQLDFSENENLNFVRDLFMFAFYCRGMELIDVAHLTNHNIDGGLLVYKKRLKGKEMRIPIEKEAAAIINHYNSGEGYLFPLLGNGRANLFQTKRTWVNNQLKSIGKYVGFPQLSFISNVDAWTTMFSNMHVSETLLSTTS